MKHLHLLLRLALLLALLLPGTFLHRAAAQQNVGIGTTAPTQTLDVNGQLRVRGLNGTGNRLPMVKPDGTLGINDPVFSTDPVTGVATAATGSAATGSNPSDVAVSGTRAYVINGNNTLQVFDVSTSTPVLLNPTTPGGTTGGTATGNTPISVAVSGTTVYVLNHIGNSLQVFDCSNPAAPVLQNTGGTATGNRPYNLAVNGTTVYVVNLIGNSLQVFDCSTPTAPILRSTTSTGTGQPVAVAVSGTMAYVVNYTGNTLQVYNCAVPTAPVLRNTTPTPTGINPRSVAVSGTTVYVVNESSNTLQAFSVAAPTAPVLLNPATPGGTSGGTATGTAPKDVAVSGTSVYVTNANSNTLQVFNVSNPAAPVLRNPNPVGGTTGGTTTDNGPLSVAVSGTTAYVVNNVASTLQVFGGVPSRLAVVNSDGSFSSVATPTLSISGQSLSLSNGNTVTLPTPAATNLTGDVTSTGAATTYNNVVPAAKGGAGAVNGILKANGAGTVSAAAAGDFPILNQNTTGNAATATTAANTTGNAATVTTNANLTGDITSTGNATTYNNAVPNAKGGAAGLTGVLRATSGTVAAATAGTDYSAGTRTLATGILKSTTSTGALTIAVAADFPTLNQNTTGNAATATTAGTVTTNANLTGDITSVGNATTYATNVPNNKGGAGTLTGLLKASSGTVAVAVAGTDYAAATGSGSYVQNQTASAQTAGFNVNGAGTVGGLLTAGTATVGGTTSVGGTSGTVSIGRTGGTNTLTGTTGITGATTITGAATVTGNATVSGNVGIGTTTPSQELDVNGDARVRGLAGTGSRLTTALADGTFAVAATAGNDPTAVPTAATGTATTGGARYVAVSGTTAYVVNYFANTFQVYNVATPSAPVQVSSTSTPPIGGVAEARPVAVAVGSSNRVYVLSHDDSRLRTYDVTTPNAPTLLNSVLVGTTGAGAFGLVVSGTRAYVTTENGNQLFIYNISAALPTLLGSVVTGTKPQYLAVSGTTAYVACYTANTLEVYNVAGSAPVLTGSVNTGTGSGPTGVAVSGTTAYVTTLGGRALQTYNVAPATPVLLGSLGLGAGSAPVFVAVSGTTAYVADYNEALRYVNVTDPTAPTLVGTVPLGTGNYGQQVAVSNNTLYVAAGNLQIFSQSARTATVNADGSLSLVAPPTLSISGANLTISGAGGNTVALPTYSGANFIQNTTSQQATATFNISGNGTIGGNSAVMGTSTLTGLLTANGGATVAGTTGITGATTIAGTTAINTTGTAATSIGNATGALALTGPTTITGATTVTGNAAVSGNVGIGVTTAATRLHARGTGNAYPATSGTAQSAGHIARFQTGTNPVLDLGGNTGNGMWLQSTDGTNLTSNLPLLLNPNGGNVGIGTGTTAPAQKLDIAGNLRVGAAATAPGKVLTQATGNNNMLPVAYGMTGNGTPSAVFNGSGNFTVTNPSTGRYDITFAAGSGLNTANLYVTQVSLYAASGNSTGFVSFNANTAGVITVYTSDITGALVNNRYFSFTAYAP